MEKPILVNMCLVCQQRGFSCTDYQPNVWRKEKCKHCGHNQSEHKLVNWKEVQVSRVGSDKTMQNVKRVSSAEFKKKELFEGDGNFFEAYGVKPRVVGSEQLIPQVISSADTNKQTETTEMQLRRELEGWKRKYFELLQKNQLLVKFCEDLMQGTKNVLEIVNSKSPEMTKQEVGKPSPIKGEAGSLTTIKNSTPKETTVISKESSNFSSPILKEEPQNFMLISKETINVSSSPKESTATLPPTKETPIPKELPDRIQSNKNDDSVKNPEGDPSNVDLSSPDKPFTRKKPFETIDPLPTLISDGAIKASPTGLQTRVKKSIFRMTIEELDEELRQIQTKLQSNQLSDKQRQFFQMGLQQYQEQRAKKIREGILIEILENEKRYLNKLELFVKIVVPSFNSLKVERSSEIETLKETIAQIESFHDLQFKFCQTFETRMADTSGSPTVGDLMQLIPEYVHNYFPFVLKYPQVLQALYKLSRTDPTFQAFIQDMEQKLGEGKLAELIREPLRQFLSYPQMLKNLSSQTPQDHLDSNLITSASNELETKWKNNESIISIAQQFQTK